MTPESNKMTLKAFTEEYTSLLKAYGADELRCILTNMALDVSSESRRDFINKLLIKNPLEKQEAKPTEVVLDEIEGLIENIREQSEREPDWSEFHDDEDSLGEFAEFIPSIYQAFDKVEALFDFGDFHLARECFDALYTILDIEDDYGRGISLHDLDALVLDEVRAKYLRSIYLTELPAERATHLLHAMRRLSKLDSYSARPKLEDMINISVTDLPEWNEFLERWLQLIKTESGMQYDEWYREATYLLYGISGLEGLAKKEGQERPRVYVDWVNALIANNDYEAALNVTYLALEKLPADQPIRAAIGDLQVICGQQLNSKEICLDGWWISFAAKPDLTKLVILYQSVDPAEINVLMQKTAYLIKTYKQRIKDYSKSERWFGNSIESPAYPDTSLLMHAYLFSHNFEDAFRLAQQGSILGWSSNNNPQPVFIGFCLARATNQPLQTLPGSLKALLDGVLIKSSSGWSNDETQKDLFLKLEQIYTEILVKSPSIPSEILNWCFKIADERICGIVGNQHRGAYDRAALLTVACTETLKFIESSRSSIFYNKIKNQFPRHSAFQAELRQAVQVN